VQRFGIRVAIVEPGVVVTPIFSKARRFADPASPYFDHVRRLLLLYQKQMPHAAQPADAARVIYEAATSPEPRLRWLVGEDARLLVAGRQRMSDEEYVAGGRAMPDDQYLEEIRQRFGFTGEPLRPLHESPLGVDNRHVVRSRSSGHWHTEDRAASRWHVCGDIAIPGADHLAGAAEPLYPDRDLPGWHVPDVAHVSADRPPFSIHGAITPRRPQAVFGDCTHCLGNGHAAQSQHEPSCEQLLEKIGAHPVGSFPALKA
jgi:hypothetical protein